MLFTTRKCQSEKGYLRLVISRRCYGRENMSLVTTSACTSQSCCMKLRRYHSTNTTICVLVLIFIIGLWLYKYSQLKSKDISNESFAGRYFSGFNHKNSLTSRARHLNQRCQLLSANTSNVKSRPPIFFLSEVNGIAVCKTPSTGSIFVRNVIRALTAPSDNDVKKIFHQGRNTIHDGKNEKTNMTAVIRNDQLTVLVTRDPYSRLFSAYIDKYFLIGRLGRELTIYLKRGYKEVENAFCGYDISFQDFLDYVFHLIETGSEVSEHFVPITVLCDLCKIKYHMVLKQESLTNDVREALVYFKNPAPNRITSIQHSLNTTSFYDSIHTLILSFIFEYKYYNSDCPKSIHFMKKMWRSFQIHGLVSDKLDFPREALERFSLADNEAEAITSVIVKKASCLPMSPEEHQRQRRDSLARAYENITQDTITKIQRVFKMDFDLFDYSNSPPVV